MNAVAKKREAIGAHYALATLSASERTVLQLIAAGKKTDEVVEALMTTRNGFYQYVHRICWKLNVPNRYEAIDLYRQYHIEPLKKKRGRR